ncbi:MAG: DUF1697 domain-containing protein [Ignavibacteria bacterium]
MTNYVSILRGINVSGHRNIKMEALRKLYENLKFQKVKSYIQSGNVVFQYKKSDAKILTVRISNSIKETFGFDVPVIVLEINDLSRIIESNPFAKDKKIDPALLHITFLSDIPENNFLKKLDDIDLKNDKFYHKDNAVYLYCPDKYSNSKLTNGFIESKLKVTATTRNWKTVNELLKIAQNTED